MAGTRPTGCTHFGNSHEIKCLLDGCERFPIVMARLVGPPVPARAATDGPDKPGHDEGQRPSHDEGATALSHEITVPRIVATGLPSCVSDQAARPFPSTMTSIMQREGLP